MLSAFYTAIALLAIGGAAFQLWPTTLFQLVGVGYLFALIFAYGMSIFFFAHMNQRRALIGATIIETSSLETDDESHVAETSPEASAIHDSQKGDSP